LIGPAQFLLFYGLFGAAQPYHNRWLSVPAGALLGACLLSAIVVGMRFRNENPGFLVEFTAGVAISGLIYFLVFSFRRSAVALFAYAGQGVEDEPQAVLLVDLLSLLEMAKEWEASRAWRSLLVASFEVVEKRTERTFSRLPIRGGLGVPVRLATKPSYQLRHWARHRGHQVAAVIRNHAEKMLETRSPFYDSEANVVRAETHSISLSLVETLTLLVRGDWQSLLVVEPTPPIKSLFRRYGPRVALAALLVFLAFVLPELIPSVIKDPISFQATVLVTAGFALIAPDVQKAADAVKSFGPPRG
jgi:hypothetical protein